MSRPPRLLVVGHAAARQGAPIVLLNFLEWLHHGSPFAIEVVLGSRGPLVDRYRRVAPTFTFDPFLGVPRLIPRLVRQLRSPDLVERFLIHRLRRHLGGRSFDLVVLNTVATERVSDALPGLGCARLVWVHELDSAIRRVGPRRCPLAQFGERFIAISEAVRQCLTRDHGVAEDRISLIPSCVPSSGGLRLAHDQRDSARQQHGFASDELVLVGCGTGSLRKGIDLLPRLMATLTATPGLPRIRMMWIGQVPEDLLRSVVGELERRGVAGAFRFQGEVDDPRPYFAISDLLLLPSREEPLGLVCLEAAQCGVPTICFEGAGGAQEFVAEDAGRVVPFLDVDAMAAAIAELGRNSGLRLGLATRAAEKVEETYTIERQGPRLLSLMLSLTAAPRQV